MQYYHYYLSSYFSSRFSTFVRQWKYFFQQIFELIKLNITWHCSRVQPFSVDHVKLKVPPVDLLHYLIRSTVDLVKEILAIGKRKEKLSSVVFAQLFFPLCTVETLLWSEVSKYSISPAKTTKTEYTHVFNSGKINFTQYLNVCTILAL
jgi:hypothetical protein